MPHAFSLSRAIYDVVVDDFISPFLAQRGFTHRRSDDWFWRWESADVLSRLSVSILKDRACDEGCAQVYVGIGFRRVEEFLHDFAPLTARKYSPRRPQSMAAGLWNLGAELIDHWIRPNSVAEVVAESILEDIRNYGLPFLERYRSLDNALLDWERGKTFSLGVWAPYYICAGYWLRGEVERAIAFADAALEHRRRLYEARSSRDERRILLEYEEFVEWLQMKVK